MTIETIERNFRKKVCDKLRLESEGVRSLPSFHAIHVLGW